MKNDTKPLSTSIVAKGHTPQYKMHKYFARRPYNVFNHIIKHYTQKGDIVLDCFCGGGVTVFESASLGRKPIGVDLNPLATFITRMQMFNGDTNELSECFDRLSKTLKKNYYDWYRVEFKDDSGISLWTEWAYSVICPNCGCNIELCEKNKVSNGIYRCSNPNCVNSKTGVKRVLCKNNGSIPIRTLYRSDITGKEQVRMVSLDNMPFYKKLNSGEIKNNYRYMPQFTIPENWDRQHEDKLYEKGIVEYSDFFTARNYILNCAVFNEIMRMKDQKATPFIDYLYFVFSSSLRYTNKMTRVSDNWEGGKPTAMDKHAFWLPNQYIETNVIDVIEKRSKSVLSGCIFSKQTLPECTEVHSFEDMKNEGSYMILNRSSSELPLPSGFVDIIITDPPYGSNVQYAELSSIWNAWFKIYNDLDNYIYRDEEAVVNRKSKVVGAKNEDDYERLLQAVYTEGARVLKPNGYLVFTFNNKNIKVWIAMLKSVANSGFYLPENGLIFQDYIESYKNTAHLRFSGNVQGDFIYSFRKGEIETADFSQQSMIKIIDDTIDETITMLFSKKKEYSTPALYQKIIEKLTYRLMQYIVWCKNVGLEIDNVDNLSSDYIENKLKKNLSYDDGIWKKEVGKK